MISDYRMPKLNGCELGTKVKELNENIKVIIISSYDSIENNNKLNFELLKKPVKLQKLLDIVKVSLNNSAKASPPLSAGLD